MTDVGGNDSVEIPVGTYDLLYTPVPNTGLREVNLPDVEVLEDVEPDVVLVPLDLAEVNVVLQDRDGVPAANQESEKCGLTSGLLVVAPIPALQI